MKALASSVCVFVLGCTAVPLKVRPALVVSPEVAERGETIYFGSSFPLKGDAATPTFVYERRVDDRDGVSVATHVTRDPSSGALVIVEAATHNADYALADYTLFGNQLGQTGSVHVERDEVTLRLTEDAGERTKVEHQTLPVVVGPTLIGFIFKNLGALRGGKVIGLRLAVLDRLETIGFRLELGERSAGQTKVKMTASNLLYALAIDPVLFTFETSTGKLVRLEGRIPPKVRAGEAWADFDARVEYRFVAPAYR